MRTLSPPPPPSMRRSSARLRALVLLLAFSLLLIAGAYRFFANPQVPQGGSASFSATGTDPALNGEPWDVVNYRNNCTTFSAGAAGSPGSITTITAKP